LILFLLAVESKRGLLGSVYSTIGINAHFDGNSYILGNAPSVPLSASLSSSGSPVILLSDPSLVDLYKLLSLPELTPALAVRRFTLPALNHMDGSDRLTAMLGLASRWATYRDDAELLTILKTIAFVPSWDSSKASYPNPDPSLPSSLSSGCHHNEVVPQYRRANELLSWENEALLETLKGPYQSRYID
jgi:hypothetical protein